MESKGGEYDNMWVGEGESGGTMRRPHPYESQPPKEAMTMPRKGSKSIRFRQSKKVSFDTSGLIPNVDESSSEAKEREEMRIIVNKDIKKGKLPLRERVHKLIPQQEQPPLGSWWWFTYKTSRFFQVVGRGLDLFWRDPWISRHASAVAGKAGTSAGSLFELIAMLFKLNLFFMLCWTLVIIVPSGLAGPIALLGNATTLALDEQSVGAILTGTGPLTNSIVFYGYYPNSSILTNFHMPTAYFSVLLVTFSLTLLLLVLQILRLNKSNVNKKTLDAETRFGTQVLSSWDHTLSSRSGVFLQHSWCTNLCRELIDEYRRHLGYSRGDEVKILGCIDPPRSVIVSNAISTVVGVGFVTSVCAAAYYFQRFQRDNFEPGGVFSSAHMQALFIPGIVTLVVYFIPFVYIPFSTFNIFFNSIVRRVWNSGVVLFATGGFLGTYLATFAGTIDRTTYPCWETLLGQEIYRLVVLNFILRTGMLLMHLIATGLLRLCKIRPFWEINVMNKFVGVAYTQALLWIGFGFVPFLPVMSLVFSVITFYLLFSVFMYASSITKQSIRIGRLVYVKAVLFVFIVSTISSCLLLFTSEPGPCGPFSGSHRIFEIIQARVDQNQGTLIGEGWNYFFLRGAATPFVIALLLLILYLKFRISAKVYLNEDLNYALERERYDFRSLLIAKKVLTGIAFKKPGQRSRLKHSKHSKRK
eukprot:m.16060 g.16060  ORF g.16060 m.16060 type:complete len:698 (+) comp4562_c0_seq1:143-2236(+)